MFRVCMVIPVYKEVPNQEEMEAINNAEAKFSKKDIFFVCPESLRADVYTVGGYGKETFPDRYFTSERAYSRLLLRQDFYQRFADRGYTHMLICQTDVWLIGSEHDVYGLLEQEKQVGHWSYYGAPWPEGRWVYSRAFPGLSLVKKLYHGRVLYSGNGGLSLRDLEDTVRLLKTKKWIAKSWNSGEDVFFAYHGTDEKAAKIGFCVAPAHLGAALSLEKDAQDLLHQGFVPIGLHAWRKYYPEFGLVKSQYTKPGDLRKMPEKQFAIPVVLFVFNRPRCAERLAKQVARIHPVKVYLFADHAREGKAGEEEKVRASVESVRSALPEDCQLILDQARENMGCDARIIDGLNKVFAAEEKAIILEDDCYPDLSFFTFCEEMLTRYSIDDRVKYIAGSNQIDTISIPDSYAFSYSAWTWGWATWARTWKERLPIDEQWHTYRRKMKHLSMLPKKERREFRKTIDRYAAAGMIPWDYVLGLSALFMNGLSIVPKTNLVINDGTGEDATHTSTGIAGYYPQIVEMKFPLSHPKSVAELPGYHKHAFVWHRESLLHKLVSPAFYRRFFKRLIRL